MSFIFITFFFSYIPFCFISSERGADWRRRWIGISAQVTNEIKNEGKKIASAATEGRSNLCERLVKKRNNVL